MSRQAWKRVRARLQAAKLPKAPSSLNTYLTTILAVATVIIAFAQYRVSDKQAEINDSLAQLEFAKTQPDFNVLLSDDRARLHQGERTFLNQPPREAKVTLASGLLKFWNASGRVTMFLSSSDGFERCAIRVHGVFKQTTRGELELVSEESLQQLIDLAAEAGLKAEGFHTDFFVVYGGFVESVGITNLSMDGSEYADDGFLDIPVVYSGAWSGGTGFYFDQEPAANYCQALRPKIISLIERTRGTAGEAYTNLSPAERNALGLP